MCVHIYGKIYGTGRIVMLMEVIRIDGGIVTGQLEDGHIIDIDQKWLSPSLQVGDMIDFTEIKPVKRGVNG